MDTPTETKKSFFPAFSLRHADAGHYIGASAQFKLLEDEYQCIYWWWTCTPSPCGRTLRPCAAAAWN